MVRYDLVLLNRLEIEGPLLGRKRLPSFLDHVSSLSCDLMISTATGQIAMP